MKTPAEINTAIRAIITDCQEVLLDIGMDKNEAVPWVDAIRFLTRAGARLPQDGQEVKP